MSAFNDPIKRTRSAKAKAKATENTTFAWKIDEIMAVHKCRLTAAGRALKEMKPIREIQLRDDYSFIYPESIEAVLGHAVGVEVLKCENCEKGFGPFKCCVVVDGYFNGSCTNCHFFKGRARCSFRRDQGLASNPSRGLPSQRELNHDSISARTPPVASAPARTPAAAPVGTPVAASTRTPAAALDRAPAAASARASAVATAAAPVHAQAGAPVRSPAAASVRAPATAPATTPAAAPVLVPTPAPTSTFIPSPTSVSGPLPPPAESPQNPAASASRHEYAIPVTQQATIDTPGPIPPTIPERTSLRRTATEAFGEDEECINRQSRRERLRRMMEITATMQESTARMQVAMVDLTRLIMDELARE